MKLTAYENGTAIVEPSEYPVPSDGEVIVKIKACGVCGSDIPRVLHGKAYYYPIVVGHEFSGVVERADEPDLQGKRVCIFPILPCKTCAFCQKEQYANCVNYQKLKKYLFVRVLDLTIL